LATPRPRRKNIPIPKNLPAVEHKVSYEEAVGRQSIYELAESCRNFRDSGLTFNQRCVVSEHEIEMFDTYYQKMFDSVIDCLITAHESKALDEAIEQLRVGMNKRRGFIKK
jgi:3-dehydroquinate dehydratase